MYPYNIHGAKKEVQYMTILIDQQSTGDGESMKNDSVKGKMTNWLRDVARQTRGNQNVWTMISAATTNGDMTNWKWGHTSYPESEQPMESYYHQSKSGSSSTKEVSQIHHEQ